MIVKFLNDVLALILRIADTSPVLSAEGLVCPFPNRPQSVIATRLNIMYDRYFGFLEPPFSVTPDPRFFYTNPVYLEVYANLSYGIQARKGFIAMTGEVGTGKTTLLRKLMRNLDGSIHTVFIFNTDVTFNELLRLILRDLGLPTQGKDRLAMID